MSDAVVIGAGPNGLVAANHLADAGWSVTVVEAQPTVGGAVRSDSGVVAGFVHDLFSAFYPLAMGSAAIRSLDLESYGLEWTHAPAVLGNPFADGDGGTSWAVLHRDRQDTAAALDALTPGDGDGWLELCSLWDRVGGDLLGALLTPFPPVRHVLSGVLHAPSAGGLEVARMLLLSVRRLGEERFRGEGPRLLLTGNALHADLSPEGAGSGVFGLLMCMLGQQFGFPAPRGGAEQLSAAMARRLEQRGGQILCGHRVRQVLVRDGRAVAVRTADGTELPARRAVIADVVATHLYGDLLAGIDLPSRVQRGLRRFEWDPATVKVDWALSSPVPWSTPPDKQPGTVHVAGSVDELTTYAAQISGHTIPAEPFLIAGQMTTTDPSRSPAGTESLWAYSHVPQRVRADAGPDGLTGRWDHDERERFADRMQARLERAAPGFSDRVVGRRVLGPHELEQHDENLVGGAIGGGTANLHQQLVFRPVNGMGRPETPVEGLYLGSSSAHPGGGVHGACGANAARAALW
ncbi:MAG: NAD(P)/FAD-dependent oxidoreductase, partial [Actinomycetota bacterium]|nr:NAD(P)/FAD-dependent oxidoreductase [Actinomycetota bacterium]